MDFTTLILINLGLNLIVLVVLICLYLVIRYVTTAVLALISQQSSEMERITHAAFATKLSKEVSPLAGASLLQGTSRLPHTNIPDKLSGISMSPAQKPTEPKEEIGPTGVEIRRSVGG